MTHPTTPPASAGVSPAAAPTAVKAPLTVTDRAARRIGDLLKNEGADALFRVSVEGGGCSGFQYKFEVDHTRAADDNLIERDGARVVVDQVSLGYIIGAQLDFVDDLAGSSFRVSNPNATASCGCGTSFTV